MKFAIRHVTTYRYDEPVYESVNELRISPRTNTRQACYHHHITVTPNAPFFSFEDAFGNRVYAFTVNAPHDALTIIAQSVVVTHENDAQRLAVWDADKDWTYIAASTTRDRFIEYIRPTYYTAFTEAICAYAHSWDNRAQGIETIVLDMIAHIHRDFVYDPFATHTQTTADELLITKKGVCQDFSHLMIALCRAIGIPARYVSGYHYVTDLQVRTSDFEQSSHAWVEVLIPGTGWVGFDPTNCNRVDGRYIKLGHGKDYADIVPVKGVYRGTPHQQLDVHVDVTRLDVPN